MASLSALLHYYRFDCGNLSVERVLEEWAEFDPEWIRLAIVEAIYRGRYKVNSVTDILKFWQRRGEPCYRFSKEFERSICSNVIFSVPPSRQMPLSLPVFNWHYINPTPFELRLRALVSTANYCS
ncbi:MAG: hypothetical protein RMK91_02565 [Pseudanabaenaceae cyanobacterium SKYGB_i_bin29]|nr:hypothetical protein [Pseudanabaenaceae cyanobacterium SKYG29]MDW8420728.1 hypothetical protein [Pseudanabaenaceae cyanobacterium SKYGB_i_bin29]